jgi:hypothetical protein
MNGTAQGDAGRFRVQVLRSCPVFSGRIAMGDREIADFFFGQGPWDFNEFVFPSVGPAQITLCTNAPRQNFPVLSAHDANLTP